MIDKHEIKLIALGILQGVEAAKSNGVSCEIPNSFTIQVELDEAMISVTYPIDPLAFFPRGIKND